MLNWIKNELKEGNTLISYGSIRVAAHASDFLVPVILATQFSPDLFGTYSLGMMIVYFFNAALIFSSSKPAIIFGNEELKESRQMNQTMTSRMIILTASIILFILFIFMFNQPLIRFTGLTRIQIWLTVPVLIGYTLLTFFGSMLMALNRRIVESAFLLTNAALSICYLLIIYFFFRITLEKVFFMFFIAPVISVCLFLPKLEMNKVYPPAFDKDNLNKMVDFTKWMVFGGAGVYLLNWCDNIVLRRFVSMEEIGIYNLGYQFFKGTLITMSIVKGYFLPFITQHKDNKEKIIHYLEVKRTKLFLLGTLLLAGLFLMMPCIVNLLYSTQYKDSVIVFRILIFGSICWLYSGFYDPIFDSMKHYRFIQSLTIGGVAFNLALDYILISRIGFIGGAIATAATYFLLAFARELYFKRYCRHLLSC